MSLPTHLQVIVDAIMAAHPGGLTLDQLSEELIHKPVTYADIDEIIGALEDAGLDLEQPEPSASPDDLQRVLSAVRSLSDELGRRPSIEEIGVRVDLPPEAVRRALRLGRSASS